jgi:hypothetical protein
MFGKDDARDPLRYMKAEMARKFGENLAFPNNKEILGTTLPPQADINSIKYIIYNEKFHKVSSETPAFFKGEMNGPD